MFCKNCGKLLSSEDKFCSECGTRIIVEQPKMQEPEPMFFTEKAEAPAMEKKPKPVIHLDEFNWNLDGYPTEKRKTEAVDFDWDSVLEDKVKSASPKTAYEDAEVTVQEMPEETFHEEAVTEVKSLEQIIEDFGEGPMEEPTKLIDKSQIKADNVDRFYVFSKKQAEYQNLLDQEYDRIQNSLMEEEPVEPVTVDEILNPDPLESLEISETFESDAPVAEEKPMELVAVVWAMPPAGIEAEMTSEPESLPESEIMPESEVVTEPEIMPTPEIMPEPEVIPAVKEFGHDPVAEMLKEVQAFEEAMNGGFVEEPVTKPTEVVETEESEEPEAEPEAEPPTGVIPPPVKEAITFADIFKDDEEEEEEASEKKSGGCLKGIAIALIVIVLVEAGILGIQKFAKGSEADKFIDRTFEKVLTIIGKTEPVEKEPVMPSEIEMLISSQREKNVNIIAILEDKNLTFAIDQDYGYEEMPHTYPFKDSPWHENEDGKEVTYGDEIIGTLIQYYSALADHINDVNKDVLNYVEETTALYEELESMKGDDTRGYTVNCLKIGEIKTGQKGFYIMAEVTYSDNLQPEEVRQQQIVYLEADPKEKTVKIKETKNI